MTFINTREPADWRRRAGSARWGEIREFVRRDITSLRRSGDRQRPRRQQYQLAAAAVAGTSVQEIDRLIAELQSLRDMLSVEGARVQREIVQYATLSQSAMQSTKIIAESLSHWKKVPDAPSIRGS